MSKTFKTKIQQWLDRHFYQIFDNSHFLYTIIFFFATLLIALLSLIPNQVVGNVILFFATVISITFMLLMFEGLIPKIARYLFTPDKKFDKWKLIYFFINFIASSLILLIYFINGHSMNPNLPIQFLGWDVVLPTLFIIIYFGWNLVQIFYLRVGFEALSDNISEKVDNKYGYSKKKGSICLIFLILALIIPFLLQIGTFIGFLSEFQQPELIWYIASNILVFIIIFITSWRLIMLYLRSKKNDTPNVFSSIFYILIWIIIWFRAFSFLNSLRNIAQASSQIDILSRFIDILLMILTAILVLRSLGGKIYDSMVFNQNNISFFLFSFMVLYIEGQIILITGAGNLAGIFNDSNQINLINNFLIILITTIFYWWYSEYSLERKGLIVRKRYNPEDVALVVNDFRTFLINKNALDPSKIGDEEIQDFLHSKNIKIPVEKPSEIKSEPKIEKDLGTDQE
ncbi:MAG: hypothetical protein Lokiarch_37650 [Candidatus Lokiarchaeum sp. GC14_75]|nr:MAG: hypothetical protein Lokiarch_37650 [Candidatus Lokiarchaeum sp. GC14_75]